MIKIMAALLPLKTNRVYELIDTTEKTMDEILINLNR